MPKNKSGRRKPSASKAIERVPAKSNGKHPGGRPSRRTAENAAIIAFTICSGGTVQEAADKTGIPASTIRQWEFEDEQFRTLLTRARVDWADAAAEKGADIAAEVPRMIVAEDGTERVDSGWVQHVTSRLNYLRWLISKRNPQRYGDKAEVALTGSLQHTHILSETARKQLIDKKRLAMETRRQRLSSSSS